VVKRVGVLREWLRCAVREEAAVPESRGYEDNGFHPLANPVSSKSQKPFDEKVAFKLTPQSEGRRRKALEKQAAALGFTLQPAA